MIITNQVAAARAQAQVEQAQTQEATQAKSLEQTSQAPVAVAEEATMTPPEDIIPEAQSGDPVIADPAESLREIIASLIEPDANGEINEEELYSGLLLERLQATHGQAAADAFRDAFSDEIAAQMRDDGYVPVEDAANAAIEQLVADEVVSQTDADSIRAQAFAAAQLDDNLSKLFDGRGSADDPTIAKGLFDDALRSAAERIAGYASGEVELPSFAEQTGTVPEAGGAGAAEGTAQTAHGGKIDGPEGYLWKPESESDGNLVVLIPSEIAGSAENESDVQVSIVGPDGEVLEGPLSPAKDGHRANGNRLHFRFAQSGADYPEGVSLVVDAGEHSTRIEIPEPAKRYD